MEPIKENKEKIPIEYGGAAMAYLGDAVLEVLVRAMLVRTGISDSGRLNAMSRDYVRAVRQSDGVETLFPLFTETEAAVYKRARNGAGAHPKSASVAEYRRATGLEAVFGYLWLCGDTERLYTLFAAYAAAENGDAKKGDTAL